MGILVVLMLPNAQFFPNLSNISRVNLKAVAYRPFDFVNVWRVHRFILGSFVNGINTLSMSTFIETDIFLFHVLLQVRLPHYQLTVLLTWKLLMALIR